MGSRLYGLGRMVSPATGTGVLTLAGWLATSTGSRLPDSRRAAAVAIQPPTARLAQQSSPTAPARDRALPRAATGRVCAHGVMGENGREGFTRALRARGSS